MTETRPSGLIAKSGLELLTFGTPNGHKITILLEELKEAYGKDYVWQSINIMQNIQKEPWFLALGANGRIPVLIDHDRNDFSVFEGAAILQYLTRFYDEKKLFNFEDANDYSTAEQWVAWQHGHLGPMQGQANHFYRFAKERIPYPTMRFVGETERHFGILETRLKDRDYIVGPGKGKYSIADIAIYSWANVGYYAGIDVKAWPSVWAWLQRISARPAVQRGTAIPGVNPIINENYLKRLETEPEFKQKEDELKELSNKAKEQYNYKYAPA